MQVFFEILDKNDMLFWGIVVLTFSFVFLFFKFLELENRKKEEGKWEKEY